MISLENISKSYGGQTLLDNVGFRLNPGERAGLVGRNGHGKTTLMRMIVGETQPDSGQVLIPKNYRIGYVTQQIRFTKSTVLEEGMTGLTEAEKDAHWKVEKILAGLGFSSDDMGRDPMRFSGGFQVRINLAKILVSDPDLLLLDEPTNYLDITAIRWTERFLRSWPRELLLITHDRGFMDKVITHTLGLHRKKVRKIPGDTGKYYEQIAQDEEIYEKTRQNDARKRKEIELFISRFRAKARLANLVQSRVKTLQKMGKKEKLEGFRNLDFSFRSLPFPARRVMEVRDLGFGYPSGRMLLQNLSFDVAAGDRICIVGRNGKGKTTLIKLLAGALPPTAGTIYRHPETVTGFYEQTNVSTLSPHNTVVEELLYADKGVDQQMARNIAGAMLFEGDMALKKISVLSGGEKSRVMLGKILATRVNLLLLDEPTNHLDMESCDALLAAVDAFEGAVIMVTHNEMFLHSLAQRLIVFQDDGVSVFDDGYARFLEKGGWHDEDASAGFVEKPVPSAEPVVRVSKKELRRRRSEIVTQRTRELKPLEAGIARAEEAIDRHEKELARLQQEMQEATGRRDGARIGALGQAIHSCESAIETHFAEMERLTNLVKEKSAPFDQRLAEIDAEGA